ncbi:MAG TPA: hypothetical protein VFX49_20155 [Chloroflexota bacterium]|nr:hypothetical protein [Chloroflexota bacterium]
MSRFSEATREALRTQGWRLADVPSSAGLDAGEVAYRPGLMPGSPGATRDACHALLTRLDDMLPSGSRSAIAGAALYEWLVSDHSARTGEWLLRQTFTWTADSDSRGYPVATGVVGGRILSRPLPEGRGRGVGVLPLVVPV